MSDPLATLRRPEYTGSNRCWPCTILNAGLLAAAVVALLLARRRRLAAVAASVGVAGITLRGYLLPYTPRIAPRLVAALPVDPFHRDDPDALVEPGAADAPTGDEIVSALFEAGIVVPEGEEVFLDDEFRRRWRTEMEALRRLGVDELAAVADDLTPARVETTTHRGWNGTYVVLTHSAGGRTSLPRAIAVAELAAARTLESAVEDDRLRLAAGRPLRPFLEACPLCDGEFVRTATTCCGEVTPIGAAPKEKLRCPDCGDRLFTFDE